MQEDVVRIGELHKKEHTVAGKIMRELKFHGKAFK